MPGKAGRFTVEVSVAHELDTEPAYKLPRKKQRPWWAAALIGGIGIGLTIVAALGLGGASAHGEQSIRTSGVSLPPGTISLDDRLHNIETTLTKLSDDMLEVKQRLPPKKP